MLRKTSASVDTIGEERTVSTYLRFSSIVSCNLRRYSQGLPRRSTPQVITIGSTPAVQQPQGLGTTGSPAAPDVAVGARY
jgi:hypothetical protein